MKQAIPLKHKFVELIPEDLDEGTLYVSIRFSTVSHLCACGCKSKVVTPLKPTDWKLTFDGKTISLYPSIGNWAFPCRSHYWIKNNRVQWAEQWSQARIDANKAYDRRAKEAYFGTDEVDGLHPVNESSSKVARPLEGLWEKLKNWWRS